MPTKLQRQAMSSKTWKFAVGIGCYTSVTVKARSYGVAVLRARTLLTKRDPDGPVAWDLSLIQVTPSP